MPHAIPFVVLLLVSFHLQLWSSHCYTLLSRSFHCNSSAPVSHNYSSSLSFLVSLVIRLFRVSKIERSQDRALSHILVCNQMVGIRTWTHKLLVTAEFITHEWRCKGTTSNRLLSYESHDRACYLSCDLYCNNIVVHVLFQKVSSAFYPTQNWNHICTMFLWQPRRCHFTSANQISITQFSHLFKETNQISQ